MALSIFEDSRSRAARTPGPACMFRVHRRDSGAQPETPDVRGCLSRHRTLTWFDLTIHHCSPRLISICDLEGWDPGAAADPVVFRRLRSSRHLQHALPTAGQLDVPIDRFRCRTRIRRSDPQLGGILGPPAAGVACGAFGIRLLAVDGCCGASYVRVLSVAAASSSLILRLSQSALHMFLLSGEKESRHSDGYLPV